MSRTNEIAQSFVGLRNVFPSEGRLKKYYVVKSSGMERANRMKDSDGKILGTSGWAVWMNDDVRVCHKLDEAEKIWWEFYETAETKNDLLKKQIWEKRRAERTAELHQMWDKQAGELIDFAEIMEPRQDWHEPDEMGIEAVVHGSRLDNAFGDSLQSDEFVIQLNSTWKNWYAPSVTINLANLLAHYRHLINWQRRQNGVG